MELAPRRGDKICEVVEVGKFYEVPTVEGDLWGMVDRWPVLGPWHEDAEIINFPKYHYHLDWRFFTDEAIDYLRLGGPLHSRVLQHTEVRENGRLVEVNRLGPVVWRRRKCRREMPPFPQYARETARERSMVDPTSWLPKRLRAARWQPALEEAYKDARLPDSLICPHRGVSLKGQPVVDGCVTCPAHGLRWDLRTRRLVGGGE